MQTMKKPVRPGKPMFYPESEEKATLAALKKELDQLQNGFDVATDPLLIDSLIYQIMSVNMRYKFHLNKCRTGNLIRNS